MSDITEYPELDQGDIDAIDALFRTEVTRERAKVLTNYLYEIYGYWPSNVRHCYYKAIGFKLVEADEAGSKLNYDKISDTLVKLRDNGILPWKAIGDVGRTTTAKRGYTDIQEYAAIDFATFLSPDYYTRCRAQGQGNYIEVFIEKEAIAGVVKRALQDFCVRITVAKGQSSATKINETAERVAKAVERGQKAVIICFNDLDPSGWAIPYSIEKRLRDVHGVGSEVSIVRGGLNESDITGVLSDSSFQFKKGDPNLPRWIGDFTAKSYKEALAMSQTERAIYAEQHSRVKPTELDALDMPDLEKMVVDAVMAHTDMDEYDFQDTQEGKDRETLFAARKVAHKALRVALPHLFP